MKRLLVLAVILMGAAACSDDSTEAGDALDGARSFERYPIFWLGKEYEGLPLTDISVGGRVSRLIYGDCDPVDPDGLGPEGGSCPVPLQIDIRRGCGLLPPDMAQVEIESLELRGVTAYRTEGEIEFATQNVLVKIYGSSAVELDDVIANLQTLNGDVGAGDPLPTPEPGLPFDQQGQCGSLGNPTATPMLPK